MPDKLGPAQAELERAYREVNALVFADSCPPTCVVTIQTRGRKKALAWYAPNRWQNGGEKPLHEINICAEHLADGPERILKSLVHEMVHARNASMGIKDCSKGRYHNGKFKVAAEAVGLIVEKSKSCGWGHTELSSSLREKLSRVILRKDAFELARISSEGKKKEGTRLVKWTCGCDRNFWAKTQMDEVVCGKCNTSFLVQG